MAKHQEKHLAVQLRKEGKSYDEIRNILSVSKSTLSGWLRSYPLSPDQVARLNNKKVENYIITRKRSRETLLKKIYDEEKPKILPLLKRDIFIGGLFLYLGEGGKTSTTELALSNTDPAIIKGFMVWLKGLSIDISKIYFRLHLYKDMNPEREISFWCKKLGVERFQFRKSYIKKSNLIGLSYKNGYGHGTCNARFSNAILSRQILMSLEVIRDDLMGQ